MTRLATGKKKRKKQSEFQKLWARAERLKQKNARFRERLDGIVQRMTEEIRPVEEKTQRQQIPLLMRLLTLGQRKSLAQWQRHELDMWIREILDPLAGTGHLTEELLEAVSRYDAFRMGVELDDDSATPVTEQLRAHIEAEEARFHADLEAEGRARREAARDEIEDILDRTFGPEPPEPGQLDDTAGDFFQDELQQEQQRAYDAYHKARKAERERLLKDMLDNPDPLDEEDDFFDFDFDAFEPGGGFSSTDDTALTAIDNAVFKRLFRSTAARLHPDREQDPAQRDKKHRLMSELLKARKQGDVMTVVQMHQQHVGDDSVVSKADEKQLIRALKIQVEELEQAAEGYSLESPLQRMAFDLFYHPSYKKTDQAIKAYIRNLEQDADEALVLSRRIKSLNTLKPHLEQRYDAHRLANPLDILDELFQGPF